MLQHKRVGWLMAGLLAAFAVSPVRAAQRPRPVTVTRLTWHGWTGCARLTNGIVEAIVVPQVGRIMAFHFAGQSGTDPLFVSADMLGKSGDSAGPGNWANFGGDKLWPSPQSDWPKFLGHSWPPDTAFDGQPQRMDIVPGGVRLTTPVSEAFGGQAVRRITLRPGEARLYIDQTLRRPASGAAPAVPLGIWSITQTRGDGLIVLPVGPASRFPGGFVTFDASSQPVRARSPLPGGWVHAGNVLAGRRDTRTSHKLGTDASAGWAGSLYGQTLFSEHFAPSPGLPYPDAGCRSEVYANAGATAYVELETLGPLHHLTPGRSATYNLYWQLNHLPHPPASDSEAARFVEKAMRARR